MQRDGVGLAFEEVGEGDPALLFLHGIACDHTHFAPQAEHFAARHRVVAMDLRGHGESDAPEEGSYGVDALVGDVAALCRELALERPVIVGHSLGGVVALAVAARHPELPAAIAALDSPLIPTPERQARMEAFIPRLRTDAYEEELRAYFSTLFAESDDRARKSRIIEAAARVPRHVVTSVWEEWALGFDTVAAAKECAVPFLYVDGGTPNTELELLAAACPLLTLERTTGSGHFLQLELPDQVNSILGRFVSGLGADSRHALSARATGRARA